MQISSLAQNTLVRQQVMKLQEDLGTAQSQLSTGKIADSLKGLGSSASRSLSLRADLTQITQYQKTIAVTEMRMDVMQATFTRIHDNVENTGLDALTGAFENSERLATIQNQADAHLSEILGMLNRNLDGRFLFSGTDSNTAAVLDIDTLLNGDPVTGRGGLRDLIADRANADKVNDTAMPGGLDVSVEVGGELRIHDDATDGFGFTLVNVTSTGNITITQTPTATDNTIDLTDLGNLEDGDTLTINTTLPDGTAFPIILTGREDSDDLVTDDFRIGPTPTDTRSNLRAAIDKALDEAAAAELRAASIAEAANMFFDTTPPKVIDVSNPSLPQVVTDSTTVPTMVSWYQGSTTDTPRNDLKAKIDDGTELAYGVRADEAAIRESVASLAVFAATSFEGSELDFYRNLADKVGQTMTATLASLEDLIGEIGSKQAIVDSVDERHESLGTLTQQSLHDIENADLYEVSTMILGYQTQLQASYQVTNQLQQLSLVNFLQF